MTTLKETLQLALDALVYHTEQTRPIHQTNEAIAALREQLAQTDEPVAVVGMSALTWVGAPQFGMDWQVNTQKPEVFMFKPLPVGTQLFIHPPAKQEPLTVLHDKAYAVLTLLEKP